MRSIICAVLSPETRSKKLSELPDWLTTASVPDIVQLSNEDGLLARWRYCLGLARYTGHADLLLYILPSHLGHQDGEPFASAEAGFIGLMAR